MSIYFSVVHCLQIFFLLGVFIDIFHLKAGHFYLTMLRLLRGTGAVRALRYTNARSLNRAMAGAVVSGRHWGGRAAPLCRASQFSTTVAKLQSQDNDKTYPLGSFKVDQPQIMIAFTCKKCDTRSSHTMSKQAYTGGTVLITCPGCKNRHLIADHLKIFSDDRITIEDILNAKGESVSQSTDDLVFEDIPESLKETIGHYASDAPESYKKRLDNEKVHTLPHPEEK